MRDLIIKTALHAAFAVARANVSVIHRLMVLRDRQRRGQALDMLRLRYR